MSFRHTVVTEFLYKSGHPEEIGRIKAALDKWGRFIWHAPSLDPDIGYFHGVIKDLDGQETRSKQSEIISDMDKVGVRIAIVFE